MLFAVGSEKICQLYSLGERSSVTDHKTKPVGTPRCCKVHIELKHHLLSQGHTLTSYFPANFIHPLGLTKLLLLMNRIKLE